MKYYKRDLFPLSPASNRRAISTRIRLSTEPKKRDAKNVRSILLYIPIGTKTFILLICRVINDARNTKNEFPSTMDFNDFRNGRASARRFSRDHNNIIIISPRYRSPPTDLLCPTFNCCLRVSRHRDVYTRTRGIFFLFGC